MSERWYEPEGPNQGGCLVEALGVALSALILGILVWIAWMVAG